MDYIIGWREVEVPFEDDIVTVEIRPLTREAMMIVTPLLVEAEGKDNDKSFMLLSTFKMQEISEKIFPDHVRNIKGFTINGNAPTIEIITKESVFARLTVDILTKLFAISTLTKDEEKN